MFVKVCSTEGLLSHFNVARETSHSTTILVTNLLVLELGLERSEKSLFCCLNRSGACHVDMGVNVVSFSHMRRELYKKSCYLIIIIYLESHYHTPFK